MAFTVQMDIHEMDIKLGMHCRCGRVRPYVSRSSDTLADSGGT